MADGTGTTTERIVAAAERRMRDSGYHGFSFREIASDVGIKSASVHHHFPTKEDLAAIVARNYTERFMAALGPPDDQREPQALIALYTDLFRHAQTQDRQMCLCGILATESAALPDKVVEQAQAFFQRNHDWLVAVLGRAAPGRASEALSTQAFRIMALLEGAMVLSRSLGRDDIFEQIAATVPLEARAA